MSPDRQIDAIVDAYPEYPDLVVNVDDPEGDTVRVQVSGDIDMVTLGHLDDTLGSLGEDHRCRHIVIDVGEVTFLAACGVSRLVGTQHRLGAGGRSLALHRASAHQQRLLRLGGFDCARNVPDGASARVPLPREN
jgi:anti-anti-sigma factor